MQGCMCSDFELFPLEHILELSEWKMQVFPFQMASQAPLPLAYARNMDTQQGVNG